MRLLTLIKNTIAGSSLPDVFNHVVPSTIYCSHLGTGDGSDIAHPIDFQNCMNSTRVIAGDTLILLSGIYQGLFYCNIGGDAANDVIIRSLNCYGADIDGGIIVNKPYVTLQNIIFSNSDANRGSWTAPNGSVNRLTGIFLMNHDCNLINNITHDNGVGIAFYNAAYNTLCYGNVSYNCGWADASLGGAQNIYFHGDNNIVKHNVFAGAFKKTFAAYGNNGSAVNTAITENVIFSRGTTLIGSGNVATNLITFIGNHIIVGGLQCGYTFNQNGTITVTDNVIWSQIAAGLTFTNFENVTVLRNKVISGGPPLSGYQGQSITLTYPLIIGAYNFNNNEYHHLGLITHFVNIEGVTHYNFAAWQALGHDVASTYDELLPAVNESHVYLNDYAATSCRKGMVVIWNWQELNTVDVDLTALGLVNGHTYTWRNAQDPLVDVDTFVYTAGVDVTFPMTGHSVAYPIGFSELLIENQFPKFGCFIIEEL